MAQSTGGTASSLPHPSLPHVAARHDLQAHTHVPLCARHVWVCFSRAVRRWLCVAVCLFGWGYAADPSGTAACLWVPSQLTYCHPHLRLRCAVVQLVVAQVGRTRSRTAISVKANCNWFKEHSGEYPTWLGYTTVGPRQKWTTHIKASKVRNIQNRNIHRS